MIKISVTSFITTLKEIILKSPSSIIFIIIGLIFITSMIIDLKKNKKINKKLFIIGWLFITLYIIIRYTSYLTILLDNLVNHIFMQLFFPSLTTYIIIIILTNIFYLVNIQKKNKNIEKIIDTIFYCSIMFLVIYTIEEIIGKKLNIYSDEIYKNQNILILIETTTIIFTTWIMIKIGKLILFKLIDISNKKTKEKYVPKTINNENIVIYNKSEKPLNIEMQTKNSLTDINIHKTIENPTFLNIKKPETSQNNLEEKNIEYLEDEYEDIEILEI